jgi:hypothetical protein
MMFLVDYEPDFMTISSLFPLEDTLPEPIFGISSNSELIEVSI